MRVPAIIAGCLVAASTLLNAQNAAAPVVITQRLDTAQARVYVATLQPHAPVIATKGHAARAADRIAVEIK